MRWEEGREKKRTLVFVVLGEESEEERRRVSQRECAVGKERGSPHVD